MEFVIIGVAVVFLVGYYLFFTMQEMKVKKAEKAVKSGDLETALSIFMNSLKKNPQDIEALWHLGNINEEKHQYPEAIGYYTKLIDLGQESKLFTTFELYRRVGYLYRRIGRDQEALDFLFQAYKMIQSSKDVLKNIAFIIYSQKFFHRALTYFEKTLQFTRSDPDFMKHYGLCQVMVEKLTEAAPLLEESVRLEHRDYQTRFILAYTYLKMGANQKAREMIEDIANNEKENLTADLLYFAVKMLFLIYLIDGNYDIVKDLVQQLDKLSGAITQESVKEEITMAYIFFRIKQGYYDVALESIGKNVSLGQDTDHLPEEAVKKLKENQSHLYDMISVLDRYKKEKEKAIYTGNKISRAEAEFSIIESKAQDAQKMIDNLFNDWRWKFIPADSIWLFFGPKPKNKFDPTLIIEKYAEDNVSSLKKSKGQQTPLTKELDNKQIIERGLDAKDPCQSIAEADIPTFLMFTKDLAEKMGFKIINQTIKTDAMASSEGQASDMLCVEKFQASSRVLFCVRRWKEPIGYLSVMNMLSAMKPLQANRLVLISVSPLSVEAARALEGNTHVNFYTCEDVISYLS